MRNAGRRLFIAFGLALAVAASTVATLAPVSQAHAQGLFSQPKYAAIVVDANTGEVLYAKRADALRYPASITKIMTLYLTFEALATGRLSLGERITVSAHAASMAPSKTKLRPGDSLTVDEAIHTVAIHSANDIAVALAERIGGSEGRFGELMTLRAQELGMSNSRFVNASGLPDARQITTARDIALLSRAVMRDYPQYYAYFGQASYDFHGELFTNHNHLMSRMPGMDGLKTGFTNAAGFNLAASAVRSGHRLITVVLGGPSTAARDENVEELLNAGFSVLARRADGQRLSLASLVGDASDEMSGPLQRAPIEEGSGEQPDLKVVVQPQLRTLPITAAARSLSPRLAEPALAATPTPELPAVKLAMAEPEAPAADRDCARKAGRRRHARAVACAEATVAAGRAHEGAAHDVSAQIAKASCPSRGRRHRHAVTCAAEAGGAPVELASARARPRDGAEGSPADQTVRPRSTEIDARALKGDDPARSGGYMIQVGAYKNSGQAKDHLGKVADAYGAIVGDASARVERAGGNYRVRFRGLSERGAKAACRALSAKGQPCMVMGAS